jgi:hypothetical protein
LDLGIWILATQVAVPQVIRQNENDVGADRRVYSEEFRTEGPEKCTAEHRDPHMVQFCWT